MFTNGKCINKILALGSACTMISSHVSCCFPCCWFSSTENAKKYLLSSWWCSSENVINGSVKEVRVFFLHALDFPLRAKSRA